MKKLLKMLLILICLTFSVLGLVACGNNGETGDNARLTFESETLEMEIFDETELQYTYTGKNSLIWSVEDSSVLTVENGVVFALKQGQTTVTVSAGKLSDSLIVTVKEVNASLLNITVDELQNDLYVADTCTLSPTLIYNGKAVANALFDFESVNETVASVSVQGVITANAIGETEILIGSSFLGKTVGDIVNVSVIPSGKITLNKDAVAIYALEEFNGETYKNTETVQATVTEKGVVKAGASVLWSSKNTNVATVENGVITAVSSGSTEVTASYLGEDGVSVKETLMVDVNAISSTLSQLTDVVVDTPISIEEYFDGMEIFVTNAFITDGLLNKNLTISNEGTISLSEAGFIGEVTLILESDKVTLNVPICIWTALISSVSEFEQLLTATEGYYRLTDSLDLTNVEWKYAEATVFKGVFDGNGKTLTNFAPTGCGLFYSLGNGAKVSNVNFVNAIIAEDNTHVGILSKDIQENAIVEIENISGNVVLNGANCGGLIGLIYRNSSVTVKSCDLYVYAGDIASGKGALVGCADGAVNMPTDASSNFISNLKLCGGATATGVDNSSKDSINLIETVKPGQVSKLNYFDIVLSENDTEVELEMANVVKVTIFGNTITDATYNNGKIKIPVSQVEGYKVNSLEIVYEVQGGNKFYFAFIIEVGEVKITNANKELLKSIPKGTLILQEDIDLTGVTWDTSLVFEGVLDGNGYAIKNLYTQQSNGFFKDVKGAVVKNIAFVNVVLAQSSGTIAYQPTGALTVENTFIEVVDCNALGRAGAICERSTKPVALNLKDVVIKMTSRNANGAIYGYQINGTSLLTNVHCIGLKDRVESVCNAGHGYISKDSSYTFYSDLNVFNGATKTLTTFLENFMAKYYREVEISQENVEDLLSLYGAETVILKEDIDLSGITWDTKVIFRGVLDGKGHAIKNLTTVNGKGLFYTASGTIKNVAFIDAHTGGHSSVIAWAPNQVLTIENVFIKISGKDANCWSGAITHSNVPQGNFRVDMTDVVVYLPTASKMYNLFGNFLAGSSTLTNVHVINDADSYFSREDANNFHTITQNAIKTESTVTNYADFNAFNSAEKTLTDFLTDCVDTYLSNN